MDFTSKDQIDPERSKLNNSDNWLESRYIVNKRYSHLNKIEKFKKLLTYLHCQNDRIAPCSCKQFMFTAAVFKLDGNSPIDGEQKYVDKKELEKIRIKSILSLSCLYCGHRAADHGKTLDLAKIATSDDMILEKIQIAKDCSRILLMKREEKDDLTQKVYGKLYEMLNERLYNKVRHSTYHMPPFEFPSIDYYVYNFVCYKYKESSKVVFNKMLACCQFYLNKLNVWSLADRHIHSILRQVNPEKYLYRAYYELWLVFCLIPRFAPSLPSFPMTQIFGLRMLRLIIRVFSNFLLNDIKYDLSDVKIMQSDLQKFINEFHETISCRDVLVKTNYMDTEFLKRYDVKLFDTQLPIKCSHHVHFIVHADSMIQEFLHSIITPNRLVPVTSIDSCVTFEEETNYSEFSGEEFRSQRTEVKVSNNSRKESKEKLVNGRVINLRRRTIVVDSDDANKAKRHCPQFEQNVNSETYLSEQNDVSYESNENYTKSAQDSPKSEFECYPIEENYLYFENLQNGIDLRMEKNVRAKMKVLMLVELQNLISKQLPKMGTEYVGSIIFDSRHRSIVLVKNKRVIGGITFRMFKDSSFTEITFCAITSREQVKGYGTLLMDLLKDYSASKHIDYFLTYADEYAVGYFLKQGFLNEITMERKHYEGLIKEYQGATLMEYRMDSNDRYTRKDQYEKHNLRHFGYQVKSESLGLIEDPETNVGKASNKQMIDFVMNLRSGSKARFLMKDSKRLGQLFKFSVDIEEIIRRLKKCRYRNIRMLYFDLLRMLRIYQFAYPRKSEYYKNSVCLEQKLKRLYREVFGFEEQL